MDRKIMKQVLAIAIFATSWLGGLTTAEGCWFRRMFGGTSQTTYMLPVAAAPAPVAATPYTTNYTTNYPPAWQAPVYAPQTQYQTVLRPYPITTYSPVAANGLVPTVSYGVQANRVPVVALQPVLTTPPATTLPPAVALPPASVAPTLNPSCNCGGTASTAYYGSTAAWSPVTTDAGSATWAGYGVTSSAASTVTGYAPTSAANYGSASDWTPVPQPSEMASYESEYTAQPSSSPSTTLKPWQVPADDSNVKGATPWMSLEEYRRQQDAAAGQNNNSSPAAADEAPRLLPRSTSSKAPELDDARHDQWRTYDDESSRPGSGVSSSSARANMRYVPPQEKQRLLPFNRPIPDPDRDGNGWDFDDKLQLQNRESRSARATTRWRAIPVSSVSSPSTASSNLDQLLEPPPATKVRQEGGWQSTPRTGL